MPRRLPDGRTVALGPERFRAPEVLFQPSLIGSERPAHVWGLALSARLLSFALGLLVLRQQECDRVLEYGRRMAGKCVAFSRQTDNHLCVVTCVLVSNSWYAVTTRQRGIADCVRRYPTQTGQSISHPK